MLNHPDCPVSCTHALPLSSPALKTVPPPLPSPAGHHRGCTASGGGRRAGVDLARQPRGNDRRTARGGSSAPRLPGATLAKCRCLAEWMAAVWFAGRLAGYATLCYAVHCLPPHTQLVPPACGARPPAFQPVPHVPPPPSCTCTSLKLSLLRAALLCPSCPGVSAGAR
jgi:hypothetical protein